MKLRLGGAFSAVLGIVLTVCLAVPAQAIAVPFLFVDPEVTPTAEPTPTESATSDPTQTPESTPSEPAVEETPAPEATPEATPEPTPTATATSCAPVVTNIVTAAGNNTVDLTWDSTAAEFAVTNYRIVLTPGARTVDVTPAAEATTQSAHIDGLRNGVEYTVSLTALNSCGESTPAKTTVTPTSGTDGSIGQLVVKYESGVSAAVREEATVNNDAVTQVGIEQGEKLGSAMQVLDLSEEVTTEQATAIAETLAADENIAWAQPNFVVSSATRPHTELGDYTNGTTAGARSFYSTATTDFRRFASSTTTLTPITGAGRGAGTVVAVIDTGITGHPDLTKVLSGYDFVSHDETLSAPRTEGGEPVSFDGDYIDTQRFGVEGWDANATDPGDWRGVAPVRNSTWHGTAMAGVIGGAENSAKGTAGIATETSILPVRALSWRGGLASDVAAAITWASGGSVPGVVDNPTPADVLNLSFTVESACSPIFADAINGAVARGVAVVAAAGNAASDVSAFAPANCDNVITVGASDTQDKRASYSNFGAGIDISAPGDGVAGSGTPGSLSLSNAGLNAPEEASYAYAQGTSVSAAFVSGMLAGLKAENPEATPSELSTMLTGEDYVRPFAEELCDPNPEISCGPGISSLNFVQVAAAGTPTNFAGYGSPSLVYLRWLPVTGATSYTIKWGTTSGSLTNTITVAATAPAAIPPSGSGPTAAVDGGATSGYQHFDAALKVGSTYYYTVAATDASGISPATPELIVEPKYYSSTKFDYTGAPQTYVVPAGVYSVIVEMNGAAGGRFGTKAGGLGGRVRASVPVVPGETLTLNVGGVGKIGTNGGSGLIGTGWNGGGAAQNSYASSGGGASDIRRGAATLADRIVVAGGGGGSAYTGGAGGAGGGLIAGNGLNSSAQNKASGGTQTTPSSTSMGRFGALGAGAYATGSNSGGGGGGYWGGNADGAATNSGGGGGSSYTGPGVTAVTHVQGEATATGDGSIAISYPEFAAVPAPANLSGSGWQRSNTLQWTPSPAKPVTGYRIQWGTSATSLTETPIDVAGKAIDSYVHSGRTLGQTYYYRVLSKYTDVTKPCNTDCYSEPSEIVSVTTSFTQTETFAKTGAGQTWTVPSGVNWIKVDALGAAGGRWSTKDGGKGGRVQATVPVTPGEVLNIYVGGVGAIGSNGGTGAIGNGYNGGGLAQNSYASGGGGATDIRRGGTALANRILVAGGGGGSAYSNGGGGAGGDLIAGNGVNSSNLNKASGGGQSAPNIYTEGAFGSLGVGANATAQNSAGAGGGYWGGNADNAATNSGGGGGSSWTSPSKLADGRFITSVVHVLGDAAAIGDGQISITYETTAELPAPTKVEANGFQSQVALKWIPTKEDATTGYRIKWGTDAVNLSNIINITGADTPSYVHTGRTIGTTYYYSVAAVYTDATQPCNTECLSAFSPVVFTTPVFTEDQTIKFTGGPQTWTVPSGVNWIQVDVVGATGGRFSTKPGGKGGRVQATVPVTPGEVLNLFVGGTGSVGTNGGPVPSDVGTGYNGGGLAQNAYASGGGGATDIRRGGTALANRILVAGGGGGSAYSNGGGGAGGDLIAGNGVNSSNLNKATGGGQSAPNIYTEGTFGSLGVGANATGQNSGGAGGGYWGGNADNAATNSGGGGGSSWTSTKAVATDDPRTIANVVHTQGYGAADANGYVVITVPTRAYPTGVRASGWQGYNVVQWDATKLSGAQSYKVYGGTSPNPTTLIGTVALGSESFTHTGLTIGSTYYYRVTIVANGLESEKSAEATAIPVQTIDRSFAFTGAPQTWTVPAGVNWVQVDVIGAAGARFSTKDGGKGGRVQATVPVTPGEVLNLYIGGTGAVGTNGGPTPSDKGIGYNGGGLAQNSYASGGGGASDIRRGGTTLSNRIVVAGGGGGSAYSNGGGGAGGGLIAGDGVNSSNVVQASGGTQTQAGGYGKKATLGTGANAVGQNSAGGGGGYWGGNADDSATNSGGGGGSSWTNPTAGGDGRAIDAVIHTQGYSFATDDGSIKITIPGNSSPTGLVGAAGNAKANITWNASEASGLVGYKLYRGTTPNPTTPVGANLSATTSSYIDTTVTNGTTYYYRIATVQRINGVDVEGPASGDISVTPSVMTVVPTFQATGVVQNWTVPAGVSWIQVDASGASGAGNNTAGTVGGKGGRVQAMVPVTPGEILGIYVGGAGTVGPGGKGWNGGGNAQNSYAGSGGGATDIRRGGTAVTDRILVAGGGGGLGYSNGIAGAGGGLIGGDGKNSSALVKASGGTQTGAGDYGLKKGTLGVGASAVAQNSAGGGGGYWGGNADDAATNSGGGGGSSWTAVGTAGIVHTQGFNAGAGKIDISYVVDADAPVVTGVTSPQASGIYRVDTEITVNVAFSESVVVSGAPTLTLNAGTRHPVLAYKSGSGTQTLSFVYRVTAGDLTPMLDIDSTSALTLGSADISDRAGNEADITLPAPGSAESLAGDKTLIVDGDPPAAPTALSAQGSATISLDWPDNQESDLKEYRIYAGTSPTSMAQLSSVLKPNSSFEHFAVARGMTYYYYVTAVDLRGNESEPSPMVSWGLPIAGVVATPGVVVASPTNNTTPVIRGNSSPGATVHIYDAGVEIGTALVANDGTYSFTPTTPLSVSTHAISAKATLADDTSGTSQVVSLLIETTAPTAVSINRQQPTLATTNADELVFRVTFSEAMTGVDKSDFVVSGSTATATNSSYISAGVYDVTVSGGDLASLNGTVGLALDGTSAMSDIAGNAISTRTVPSPQTYTLDNNFPTVTVTADKTSLGAGMTSTLTFTLSKPSTDFAQGDVSATKGALSAWTALSSTVYTATYTPTAGMTGTENVTVRGGTFTDATGMSNISGSVSLTLDTQAPTVLNVTSTTANNSYTVGSIVDVTVKFDEVVTVLTGGGIPSLLLETGVTDRAAPYLSGSGTDTLTFRYTIVAGDTSSDLNYQTATALGTNGGSIKDAAGNNATLTLPAVTAGTVGSLATNAAIVIDTTAPATPTALVLTPAGTSVANTLLAATTNLTATATITAGSAPGGVARLYLGSTVIATDTSISGTDTSVSFDLGAASAADLQAAVTAGGSVAVKVFDLAGNASAASTAVALSVDYVLPTVAITSSASTLIAGQTATITFTLSETSANFVSGDVIVSGGSLSTFVGSGKVYTATFTPSTNSNIAGVVSVAGGVFTDALGNGNLGSALPALDVDTAVPSVTGVSSSTTDGLYGLGSVINLTVTFSEPVIVNTASGVPTLTVETGITDRQASFVSGSGTNTLTFRYTVVAGDSSADLNHQSSTALALNNGTIKDASGNPAVVTLPAVTSGTTGALATNKAIVVDTIAPTAPTGLTVTPVGSTVANALLAATTNMTVTATIVAGQATGGSASLMLSSTIIETDTTIGASDNSVTFNLNSATAAELRSLIPTGGALTVVVTDAAGNVSGASNTVVLTVDYVVPTVTISSSSTSLIGTQAATVTFVVSENLAASGAGALMSSDVTVTNGTLGALTASGNTYTATFTPTSGTSSATASVSINPGAVTDEAGNPNAASNTVAIAIDNVAPTVAKFDSSSANGYFRDGDTVTISATMSEQVRAGSTIRVILDSSSTPIELTAATASTTLTGSYTVAAGETSADLTVSRFSVVTNSVLDAAGNELSSLSVPTGANNIAGSKAIVIDALAPDAPTNLQVITVGGTTVSGVLNSTNINLGATATIVAGQATDGKAELLLGSTVIAIDSDINSSDSTVTFDLGTSSTAGLQAAIAAGGVLRVRLVDAALNSSSNSVSNQPLSVDYVKPTMAITSSRPALTVGQTATITFTLSEETTNFIDSDVVVTGGALGSLAQSTTNPLVYTATFTPSAGVDSVNPVITVGLGNYTDAASNPASAASSLTLSADTKAPVVSSFGSTTADGSYRLDEIINVTATMSETVRPGSTITVTLNSGATAVLTTATASNKLSGTFTVALGQSTSDLTVDSYVVSSADSVLDAAGNALSSTALPASSNIADAKNISFDLQAPTKPTALSFTAEDGNVVLGFVNSSNKNLTAEATIVADEATGGKAELLLGSTVIATDSSIASGDTQVTFDFGLSSEADLQAAIALAGNLTVRLVDPAGNVSNASTSVALAIDYDKPTVTIASDVSSLKLGETATITFILSDAATDFDSSDVSVSGGSISALTGSGTSYTATFTPNSASTTTARISVNAGVFTEAHGNTNAASARTTMSADTVVPVISGFTKVTTNATSTVAKAGDKIRLTVTSGENLVVTGSPRVEITVGTSTVYADYVSGSGTSNLVFAYTVADGDTDTDGISLGAIGLNSGTIADVAGNDLTLGFSSPTNRIDIDTTAPAQPVLTAMVTSSTTPAISGTASADSIVKLYDASVTPAILIGTATAGSGGTWSMTSTTLTEGDHIFVAYASDIAGNISVVSADAVIRVDQSAPSAPVVTSITPDSGRSASDALTSDDTLTLTGTTEAGAVVELFLGGSATGRTVTADSTGAFSITTVQLVSGAYALSVKATDTVGNTSPASTTQTYTIDLAAPSAPSITGPAATKQALATLTGSSEANARVELFDGTTSLGTVISDGNGAWSLTLNSPLADGTYSLKAQATDAAGNVSALGSAFSVTIDTTAPALSFAVVTGDNIISLGEKNLGVTLTGFIESGSTVIVKVGSLSPSSATVTSGTWSYTLSSADWAEIGTATSIALQVTATDAVGNTSTASASPAVNLSALAVPSTPDLLSGDDTGSSDTDNRTSDKTPRIEVAFPVTGSTQAALGQSLTLSLADGQVLGQKVLTSDDLAAGSVTFALDSLNDNTYVLTATLSEAGNVSSASSGLSLVIDNRVPDAPGAPTLRPTSDTGISSSDGVTSTTTPTVRVALNGVQMNSTAIADGDFIVIADGTTDLTTVAVSSSDISAGYIDITVPTLSAGSHALVAKAKTAAGNYSPASPTTDILVDTAGQGAPGVPDLIARDDSGSSSSDDVTNISLPTVSVDLSGVTLAVNDVLHIRDSQGVVVGTHTLTEVEITAGSVEVTLTTALVSGSNDLTSRIVDRAGNNGSASQALTVTFDATAPSGGTVAMASASDSGVLADGITSDVTPTINVSGLETGSTVVVTAANGQGSSLSCTVSGASCDLPALSSGTWTISLTQTDAAGNVSSASAPITVVVDAITPASPSAINVSLDSGSSATDEITSDTNVDISGSAEAGSTVEITVDGSVAGSLVVDGAGVWSFATGVLVSGEHTVSLSVTDVAGNVSASAQTFTINIDTTAPAAPIVSTSGATSDTTPTMTGTAEAGALIDIFAGATLVGSATASVSGAWSFTPSAPMAEAIHSLTARATDIAGNVSPTSAASQLRVDTTAPVAPVVDALVTQQLTQNIVGTAEAGSTVVIKNGSTALGTVTANSSGAWTLATTLAAGSYTLVAESTDAAGNVTSASFADIVSVDTAAPDAPVVTAGSSNRARPTVSGTSEPLATIILFDAGTEIGRGTSDGSGVWQIVTTTALTTASHQLSATATDRAGNTSPLSASAAFAIDVTPPAAPSVNAFTIYSLTPTISGTSEPGAQVDIFDGTQLLGTVTASGTGSFSFIVSPALSNSAHTFTAAATDTAGNTGVPSSVLSLSAAWAAILSGADSTDDNDVALTALQYAALGVTSVDSAVEAALLNDIIDTSISTAVNTVAELADIARIIDALMTVAAGGTPSPALTASDLRALGLSGVTSSNLNDVLVEIAATANNGSGISPLSALTALVDSTVSAAATRDAALAIISVYTGAQSETVPALSDYSDVGVAGLTSSNLASINTAIAQLNTASTDSANDVQAIVNVYLAILEGADGTRDNDVLLTAGQFATLGFADVNTAAELSFANSALDSRSSVDVDTWSELDAITTAAVGVAAVATGGTATPALTPAAFAALGITGVTSGNIDDVIAALTNSGVTDAYGLQNITSQVIASQLATALNTITNYDVATHPTPTPTPDTYANAGVTGVTSSTVSAINSAIDAISSSTGKDSATEVQTIADLYSQVLAGADGDASNNNANLSTSQFAALGLTSIDSAAEAGLLNELIDGSAASAVDTYAELSNLARIVDALFTTAAGQSPSPALTVADLQALGFTNVTASNLADVLAQIAGTANDGSGVDSIAELTSAVNQAVAASATRDAAVAVISSYTGATGETAPDSTTFTNAGVTGVTVSNLDAITSALAALPSSATNSVAEVQAVVEAYSALLAGADGTRNSNVQLIASQYAALGFTDITTTSSLALMNRIMDTTGQASIDTYDELKAYADVVSKIFATAAGASVTPALTAADLQLIGITGVTATNIASVRASIIGTADDGTGVDSLIEIQALVDTVVANALSAALSVLTQYSGQAGAVPAVEDYSNAGISGVTSTNLDAINSILAALPAGDKSSAAQIQAIIDAYNLLQAGADGDGTNNNVSLSAAQYAMLGLDSIDSTVKASLLNDVIDGLAPSAIDSAAELTTLSRTVAGIMVAAAGGTANPALSASSLTALGITGVTTDNLSAILAAIAATANDGSGVDTVAELNALIQAAVTSYDAAMTVIASYTGSNTAPSEQDYAAAGIEGVSVANISVLNSIVAELSSSATDTAAELTAILTSVNAVIIAADGAENGGAAALTQSVFTNLGLTSIDSATEVELLAAIIDSSTASEVDTAAELANLASIVSRLMVVAAGGTASPLLTAADFAAIGITGVTTENLTLMIAAVAATTDGGSGIAPLSDLQAVVTDAVVAAATAAISVISGYDGTNATTAPSLNDFVNAGITGLSLGTIAGFNTFVAALSASAVDTQAEIQAAVDAYLALLAGANGVDDDNANVTLTQFGALGLGGVIQSASAALLFNDVIDSRTASTIDTYSEANALAVIVGKVMGTAASGSYSPALTIADFTALGIEGVTSYNLDLVIAAIAATADNGTDVDTIAELTALVTHTVTEALADALAVLSAYDGTSGTVAPSINDYFNAGVSGVTSDNLSYVNAALAQKLSTDRDAADEVQALVNPFLEILAGAEGIDDEDVTLTAAEYIAIGLTSIDTAGKAALMNEILDQSSAVDADSMAELINMGYIVRGIFATATDSTPARALTPEHFATISITGVTDVNLPLILKALEATSDDASGVDSLAEIQSLVTAVADAQNDALELISTFDGTQTAPTIRDYVDAGVINITGSSAELMTFFNGYISVLPLESTDTVDEIQAIFDACLLIYIGADGTNNDNVTLTIEQYQLLGFVDVTTQEQADDKNDFIDTFDMVDAIAFESPEITAVAPADGKLELSALLAADPDDAEMIDQLYAVDHFVYLTSVDDGAHWSDYGYAGTNIDELVVDGLTNGVEYSVKIRAISPVAASLLSTPEAGIPVAAALPPAPGPVSPVIGQSTGDYTIPAAGQNRVDSPGVVEWKAPNTALPELRGEHLDAGDFAAYRESSRILGNVTIINGTTQQITLANGAVFKFTAKVPADPDRPGQLTSIPVNDGIITVVGGSKIGIDASGFAPNTSAEVWLFSQPVYVGPLVADATGRVMTNLTIPASVVAGEHTLEIRGMDASGAPMTVQLGIEVIKVDANSAAGTGSDSSSSNGGIPWWVWVVLPLLVILLLVGVIVIRRRRRS